MKTTRLTLLGVFIGSSLLATAQDASPTPVAPQRPHRPIPPNVLKQFDKDGDGKLSPDEHKSFFVERQAKIKERNDAMLAKYDEDKDGKLSPEELAKARADMKAEIVKKYDLDGDGVLSDEEKANMPRFQGGPDAAGEKPAADGKKDEKPEAAKDGDKAPAAPTPAPAPAPAPAAPAAPKSE